MAARYGENTHTYTEQSSWNLWSALIYIQSPHFLWKHDKKKCANLGYVVFILSTLQVYKKLQQTDRQWINKKKKKHEFWIKEVKITHTYIYTNTTLNQACGFHMEWLDFMLKLKNFSLSRFEINICGYLWNIQKLFRIYLHALS